MIVGTGRRIEQFVLQTLDAVVEDLDRIELAVHDDVEQTVHQARDAVPRRVEFVPPPGDLLDVELRRQPDRHQGPLEDERGDPVFGEQCDRFGVGVGRGHLHGVDGEERVGGVDGRLHPLRRGDRVLDRPDVETQLLRQIGECGVVGSYMSTHTNVSSSVR